MSCRSLRAFERGFEHLERLGRRGVQWACVWQCPWMSRGDSSCPPEAQFLQDWQNLQQADTAGGFQERHSTDCYQKEGELPDSSRNIFQVDRMRSRANAAHSKGPSRH